MATATAVSAEGLREALSELRPEAQWLDDNPDSHRSTAAQSGEWWVVDGVEGAVNCIHGVAELSVNITLIRDNRPVLAVVYQPVGNLTYTAVRGGGSHLNGAPLAVSGKSDLELAIVTKSQAGGTEELNRRTADTIGAMFDHARVLLAAEVGAIVTDLDGQRWAADTNDVVVAHSALHGPALEVLATAARAPSEPRGRSWK